MGWRAEAGTGHGELVGFSPFKGENKRGMGCVLLGHLYPIPPCRARGPLHRATVQPASGMPLETPASPLSLPLKGRGPAKWQGTDFTLACFAPTPHLSAPVGNFYR